MHVKPQNHILIQGQQDHPLDCSQQQLAIVPHCLHYFCSFSPHPDNARGWCPKGFLLITWSSGREALFKTRDTRRDRRLWRITKGKQQEKEKGGEGIHQRLSETSTAQRPRCTTFEVCMWQAALVPAKLTALWMCVQSVPTRHETCLPSPRLTSIVSVTQRRSLRRISIRDYVSSPYLISPSGTS